LDAEISLSYKIRKDAEAVTNAVFPDNIRVPYGLFIRTKRQGTNVVTKIECKKSLQTLIATIDDLLSAVSVAEKSISAVKKH
jgi:hypothetical protein